MTARLLLLLFFALASGCASLNQQQCLRGDWYGIGMADGRAGESAGRLNAHIRACAEYGVRIDEQRYFAGRSEGLKTYCRLENAFATGLAGQRYQGVCPAEVDAAFAHYNNAAYAVYRTRQDLDDLEDRISDAELRLAASRDRDDRRRLRLYLDELDQHYDDLRFELRTNLHYLEYLQSEADNPPRP
ncbi:MAG: DUF2799 domain-containing protein [Desulfobulbus sp.]